MRTIGLGGKIVFKINRSARRANHFRLPKFPLSSPLSKNISVFPKSNHLYSSCVLPDRGALRNVINAGRDAVDADAPLTNGAEADGEVVWS
jgi:hypothetical protein